MAFRFQAGEPTDDAVRRCAVEQLDKAIADLNEGVKADPVSAVHDARKALKKERALLRLVRGAISSGTRRRQNAALRDCAKRLSGTRDADVMLETIDALCQRYAGQLLEPTFAALREQLAGQGETAREALMGSGVIAEVSGQLHAIRSEMSGLELRKSGWSAIEPGLERGYRRGAKAMRTARRTRTAENLHQWRKRVKDLWYHLLLLEETAPHAVSGYADDAHLLSDLLGDDHDLAVLAETLESVRGEVAVDVEAVLSLIATRREQLQGEAFLLGARVYAESPKHFNRRLHRYWKAWRAEARVAEQGQPAEAAARSRAVAPT